MLIGIAEEEGLRGPHLRLFEAIGRVHEEVLGRRLPLNGAGVCGAALADLGLPVELLRGFALLARAAGLLGQIAEERRRPIGMDAYLAVDRNAVYVDPSRGLSRASRRRERPRASRPSYAEHPDPRRRAGHGAGPGDGGAGRAARPAVRVGHVVLRRARHALRARRAGRRRRRAVGRGSRPGTRVLVRHRGRHGAGRRHPRRAVRWSPDDDVVPLADDVADAAARGARAVRRRRLEVLTERARLQAGERVLVLGAGGAVGQVAVAAAKLLGAGRVVAVCRSAEAQERAPPGRRGRGRRARRATSTR